ncbi:mitochondrial carrier [Ascobolus immersus RN42]|uniref:Mitochondrial carrier n=1 Tax=Ascobolus immersus RN42 TaxID=1160509 RepID=A0A3N4I364_ASCIM|nr:mitochondrial carrier [Ascobolus immersus RN42]
MTYYNSDLDAFTLYHENKTVHYENYPPKHRIKHHKPHHHTTHHEPSSAAKTLHANMPTLGHAISGAVGSSLSSLAVYPLDLIVKRLQVQKALMQAERVQQETLHRRFRKDRAKELGRRASDSFNEAKRAFLDSTDTEGEGAHSSTSEESKITERRLAEKIEMEVRKNLEENHGELYEDYFDAIKKIYEHEGVMGFYRGAVADVFNSAGTSFWYFLAYTFIRTRMLARSKHNKALPVYEELLVGMAAGAISKFITSPISNLVTRLQTDKKGKSVRRHIAEIYFQHGLPGFWAGYSATLALTINSSLTFLLYEYLKLLIPAKDRTNPNKKQSFLLGALSKAISTSITYPLSVAKTRAQIGSPIRPDHKIYSLAEYRDWIRTAAGKKRRGENIIEIMMKMAKEEGVGSLYSGIEADILKGFFSHGITMLIKESVFATLSKLYILYLHLLRKNNHDHSAARSELASKVKAKAAKDVKETAASVAAVPTKVVKATKKVVKVRPPVGDGRLDGRVEAVREAASEASRRIVDAGKGRWVTSSEAGFGANGWQVGFEPDEAVKERGGDLRGWVWNKDGGVRKGAGVVVGLDELMREVEGGWL